jgi:hypothetical protein
VSIRVLVLAVALVACGDDEPAPVEPSGELAAIFAQDQRDRIGPVDWSRVGPRDARRRARVRQILTEGGAEIAADFYNAAVVFEHGSTPDDFEVAHELALRVLELEPTHPDAGRLAAAAKDRYRVSTGQPSATARRSGRETGAGAASPSSR